MLELGPALGRLCRGTIRPAIGRLTCASRRSLPGAWIPAAEQVWRSRRRHSIRRRIRFVHDACGDHDSREFARRLGLMIASGNGDAHLKNWGLLWGDRNRPTLVPCYDLVSTIALENMGWQRRGGPRLALRLGTTHRFADLDDEMLECFASATGCSWAADEIRIGIDQARNAYRALSVSVPKCMASALSEHWRRVPVLRRFGPLRGPNG
jgi:serine/threonine-protein kinase HipA